jgi:hypothetical protein
MIALPSFLAAIDKPQAKPVLGGAEAQETEQNQANDGFAALIAQLTQIVPLLGEHTAETDQPAGDQSGNPASGKFLPVDDSELAVATAGVAASQAPASASPLPVSAALMRSSATIISFQQAQTALVAKQGEPNGQATNADLVPALAKDGAPAPAALRADQIRMTVAVAPVQSDALAGGAPQHASAPVEKQLSAAIGALRADGTAAGSLPTEMKQSGREPQVAAATVSERTESARTASFEKDTGSGERSGQPSTAENSAGAARASASSESAKPFAIPVIAALETAPANRNDGVRMAAAAPTNAMTSIENIERLVERLSVAREFDMSKPASIAVTHREFGALTVTFDNARSGLDVEIAAKDNDMQRALAQAVAADRPASRAGEPLQQSHQPASQATSTGWERGAGSAGQGAGSAGAGAEGDRSHNQRDRSLPSSRQDPRSPASPSPSDDALYA